MVGDMGGFDFHLPGVAVCEAQAVYEPYVGVDLSPMILEAADPGGALGLSVVNGAVTDVNGAGCAVGWVQLSVGSQKPFFFSPVDGGSVQFLGLVGTQRFMTDDLDADGNNIFVNISVPFTGGSALALTDVDTNLAEPWKGIIIAGNGTGAVRGCSYYSEALYWTWNDATAQWDAFVVFRGLNDGCDSGATDINNNGQLVAWADLALIPPLCNKTNIRSHLITAVPGSPPNEYTNISLLTTQNSCYVDKNTLNALDIPYGINNAGTIDVVGGENYSETTDCVNGPFDSHAFIKEGITNGAARLDIHPGTTNESVAFAINDSRDIVGYAGSGATSHIPVLWWNNGNNSWTKYDLFPLPGIFYAAEAMDINNQNEVVGNYSVGDTGGFYIVLDSTDPGSGNSQVEDLDGKVIFPLANRTTAKVWTANSINENGWIGGSYTPDGAGAIRHPMLYIPNDVNNNQIPDIREIMLARVTGSGELDANGNWLLDSAEQMRVGLFAPRGMSTATINPVQVVRLMVYDDTRLAEIVADTNGACSTDVTGAIGLNYWGLTEASEIILNSRTVDPSSGPDFNFDHLLSPSEKLTNLNDIRAFAYRFARCIDGMQFGNEIFTGPGRYFFQPGEIPGFAGGDIKNINQSKSFAFACDAIFTQLGDQVEAARVGSALAGRPLRIFGPGIALAMTKTGYCGNVVPPDPDLVLSGSDKAATAINGTANYVNDNRLIFDQHTNYTSQTEFEETVDRITGIYNDPGCGQKRPWGDGPDFLASLENGPVPSTNWWNGNSFDAKKFFPVNGVSHTCAPDDTWDQFVNLWFIDLNEFGGYFPIPEVFSKAAGSGFQYICVNTNQQGLKSSGALSKTVMGTLIASKMDSTCVADPDKFMAIKGFYESAAAQYKIIPFNPHPNGCDPNVVCPQ